MSLAETDPGAHRSFAKSRWGLTGLSALGLTLSAYLSWHYVEGASMPGCSGGNACDELLNSRWATVAGVLPVSGLAASAYLAMLACSFSVGPAYPLPVRRLAWSTLLVLSGAAAGSALWFIALQTWELGAFCMYCMATHVVSLVLAGWIICCVPRGFGDERNGAAPAEDVRARTRFWVIRVGFGLALAGILVAAQVGLSASPKFRGGESPNALRAADPHAAPLIGSPDARYVVTLLFDYQCVHCQQLHLMLGEAIRRYHGQLAFALCPAPLNRRCNPYVLRDADEFQDSCELAKVALAVWRADPDAFSVFENWMYSFDTGDRWHPRTLEAARAKAGELLGGAKFAAVTADPWIERYLETSVRLFGETQRTGAGGVPKLVFGSRWVTPQPRSAVDLISILQNSLAVPPP